MSLSNSLNGFGPVDFKVEWRSKFRTRTSTRRQVTVRHRTFNRRSYVPPKTTHFISYDPNLSLLKPEQVFTFVGSTPIVKPLPKLRILDTFVQVVEDVQLDCLGELFELETRTSRSVPIQSNHYSVGVLRVVNFLVEKPSFRPLGRPPLSPFHTQGELETFWSG